MMWGYDGIAGGWTLFPVAGVVMMGFMVFFMTRMMRQHRGHDRRDYDEQSHLAHEIQNLRHEIDELKRNQHKGDI